MPLSKIYPCSIPGSGVWGQGVAPVGCAALESYNSGALSARDGMDRRATRIMATEIGVGQ